jgi:PPOX class probable F420-dependent enzyme
VPALDAEAGAFLDDQRVAHLATASADGVPHVVPVCFARLDERLYIAIDEKPKRAGPTQLRRVQNILHNPRVALVADVYDEDWSRLAFVLVHGTARVLADGAEHERALDLLRARYPQYRTMALEQRPVIAIDIERSTAWGTSRALRARHVDGV